MLVFAHFPVAPQSERVPCRVFGREQRPCSFLIGSRDFFERTWGIERTFELAISSSLVQDDVILNGRQGLIASSTIPQLAVLGDPGLRGINSSIYCSSPTRNLQMPPQLHVAVVGSARSSYVVKLCSSWTA